METNRKVIKWLMSDDVGISSETIVSAAVGIKRSGHFSDDAPSDTADFGRCYRLLKKIPELRARQHSAN